MTQRWHDIYNAPLQEDLAPLALLLAQNNIPHRIVEEAGEQVLYLAAEVEAWPIEQLIARWKMGDVELSALNPVQNPVSGAQDAMAHHSRLRQFPLTIILLLGSLLGFISAKITMTGSESIITALTHWFAYRDFTIDMNAHTLVLHTAWQHSWEIWRVFTPAFLHFTPAHIVFNSLWVWEIGRRIEAGQGWRRLLLIVLLTGAGSNVAQFTMSPAELFGGMSGVIYGLLGYCWLYYKLRPQLLLRLPPGVIVMMLGWLVLCMTGIMKVLGLGDIANTAHVSGLVLGMVFGVMYAIIDRRQEPSRML